MTGSDIFSERAQQQDESNNPAQYAVAQCVRVHLHSSPLNFKIIYFWGELAIELWQAKSTISRTPSLSALWADFR